MYVKERIFKAETKIGNSVFKEAAYVCGEGFKEEEEEEGF